MVGILASDLLYFFVYLVNVYVEEFRVSDLVVAFGHTCTVLITSRATPPSTMNSRTCIVRGGLYT